MFVLPRRKQVLFNTGCLTRTCRRVAFGDISAGRRLASGEVGSVSKEVLYGTQ